MKISKNWLSEFLSIPKNINLENELTQLGLEVDSIKKHRDDFVIDIEITPNRGDCLSVYGTARDLSAHREKKIKMPLMSTCADERVNKYIKTISKNICPEYRYMTVDNIDATLKTPKYIHDKLVKSEITSVNLIVDISNYVMIELGQPTHAFDRDKINGKLSIKPNYKKNIFIGIDNKEYVIDKGMPVIIDEKNNIHALPGVIGSKLSAVSASTKSILFESAFFIPDVVRAISRKFRIQTDSSFRFERGVDYNLCNDSLRRIHYLLRKVLPVERCKISKISQKHPITKPKSFNFEYKLFERILGLKLNIKKIRAYLINLGFVFKGKKIFVPSYRFDISNNYDLVEEVCRLYGYDNVLETPLETFNVKIKDKFRINDMLVVLGYKEVINFTFISKNYSNKKNQLILQNPISKDKAVMRESLLPGLLNNVVYNSNRKQKSLQLFEKGKIYSKTNKKITELNVISAVLYGNSSQTDLVANIYKYGIADLKATILSLIPNARFNLNDKSIYFDADNSLKIYTGDRIIGECGVVESKILNDFDLKEPLFAFEILEDSIVESSNISYKETSQFPAVYKDITIMTTEDVSTVNIIDKINKSSYKYMKNIRIKDIFINKDNLQLNNRNVTLEICLQSNNKTLTDEDISNDINKLIFEIKNNFKLSIKEA